MRRLAAFTLLEVALAIVIGLMLVLLSAPSINGLMAERGVRKSFERFDQFVREAQARSIQERRSYLIAWEKQGLIARPEVPLEGDDDFKTLPGDKETYQLELPASLRKDPEPAWVFWPSGACEPAIIRHGTGDESWTARYDPLSGEAILETGNVR